MRALSTARCTGLLGALFYSGRDDGGEKTMQPNSMMDWYRIGGLATGTLAAITGFATEILHLWKIGF